jgi:hypothetical protein
MYTPVEYSHFVIFSFSWSPIIPISIRSLRKHLSRNQAISIVSVSCQSTERFSLIHDSIYCESPSSVWLSILTGTAEMHTQWSNTDQMSVYKVCLAMYSSEHVWELSECPSTIKFFRQFRMQSLLENAGQYKGRIGSIKCILLGNRILIELNQKLGKCFCFHGMMTRTQFDFNCPNDHLKFLEDNCIESPPEKERHMIPVPESFRKLCIDLRRLSLFTCSRSFHILIRSLQR